MSDRAGPVASRRARSAPFSRVARLLLFFSAICLTPLMSACVLPIAPEFQDPPASANYAPFFVTTAPALGFVATTANFSVTVSDPNVGDDLYVRWIANFPPASGDTRSIKDEVIPHSADGTPLFAESSVRPACIKDLVANLPSHRVMVVVSDQPFLDVVLPGSPDVDYARVKPGAGKLVGLWTLDLLCTTDPKGTP